MYGENIKTLEDAGGFFPAAMGFVRGALIAAAVTLAFFALFACLLAYTGLAESAIPIIAAVVEGAGALISGFYAARGAKSRGFFTGLAAGALYMAIIWIISVLSGSGFTLGSHTISFLITAILCGAVGGVLGVNLNHGTTNRRKK